MKLIIQIPCHNEAETLPATINDFPDEITGIDHIEYLVVDDGSTDATVETARRLGVHHIVSLPRRRGLARAFEAGIRASLDLGADLIVNTDADNQYCAQDIPRIVEPILMGRADMVVGARPINDIEHFSKLKKALQRLGSWVVRLVSGTNVPDATSGFRAFSRETAMRLSVFSHYTYTLETLIQAGRSEMVVTWVPVHVNPPLRESRLIGSLGSYLKKSIVTIVRIFILYKPLRFFLLIGAIIFTAGFLLGLRFLYYYGIGEGQGHVQSLILAAILLLMGFQLGILGLVADLIASNRRLLEEIRFLQQRDRLPEVKQLETTNELSEKMESRPPRI